MTRAPGRRRRRNQANGNLNDDPPGPSHGFRDRADDRFNDNRSHGQGPRDDGYYESYPSRPHPPRSPRRDFWQPPPNERRRSRSPPRRSPRRDLGHDKYRDDHLGNRRNRSPGHQSGDNWRPPQSDFTFRVDKPAGIVNYPAFDSHQGEPERRRHDSYGGRPGGRRGRTAGDPRRRPGGPGPRRTPWKPFHPSTRALLAGGITKEKEDHFAAGDSEAKFRNLNELSDDEEQEMDMSSRSSAQPLEDSGPPKKRVKTAENVPKWSNPDPYTALPPPDEQSGKQKDVVALIRKARIESTTAKPAASTEAENFISFDTTDDEGSEHPGNDNGEQERASNVSVDAYEPPPAVSPLGTQPSAGTSTSAPPPPGASLPSKPPFSFPHPSLTQSSSALGPPPPLPPPPPGYSNGDRANKSGPLGSRKRTADDEIIEPPDYGQGQKGKKMTSNGRVNRAWEPKRDEEPCPWVSTDHSSTKNLNFR